MIGRGLQNRQREPELMDQPGLDSRLHAQALDGLSRVNLVSRTAPLLWKSIRELHCDISRPLRILDVACGGGDTAIALAQLARRSGVNVEITGIDMSPTAIAYANRSAESAGVAVHFMEQDVLNYPLPDEYDAVSCSLFLHHLDEDEAVELLGRMRQAARQLVLVSDLNRTRLGYLLTYIGIRLLTRSRICHVDGPLSVRAAFTAKEILELATRAGLNDPSLRHCWPERYLLTWRRT